MRSRREDLPLRLADQQAVLGLVADQAVVVDERGQRGDLPAGQVAHADVRDPPDTNASVRNPATSSSGVARSGPWIW